MTDLYYTIAAAAVGGPATMADRMHVKWLCFATAYSGTWMHPHRNPRGVPQALALFNLFSYLLEDNPW